MKSSSEPGSGLQPKRARRGKIIIDRYKPRVKPGKIIKRKKGSVAISKRGKM